MELIRFKKNEINAPKQDELSKGLEYLAIQWLLWDYQPTYCISSIEMHLGLDTVNTQESEYPNQLSSQLSETKNTYNTAQKRCMDITLWL